MRCKACNEALTDEEVMIDDELCSRCLRYTPKTDEVFVTIEENNSDDFDPECD